MPTVDITIRTIDESSPQNKKTVGSLTELNSAISIVRQGFEMANQVYDATIGKHLVYADSVRDLSLLSKTTAEESSKMIQVFKDFGVESGQLTPIIKAMTTQGLRPNLETIAALADQYRAIQDPVKQNEFLFKNLGRAGDDLAEILSKGGDAVLKMGDAVDKSLILNQKALDDARAQEIAVDNWKESWEGLVTVWSTKALPVLTSIINASRDEQRAHELAADAGQNYAFVSEKTRKAFIEQAAAEREATDGLILQAEAVGTLEEMYARANQTGADYTAMLQDQSEANTNLNTIMNDFQGIADSYNEKNQDLLSEQANLITKKQELINQGYLPESEAIQDINAALDENAQKQQENADAAEEATKRRIAAMVEQKLMADGALSDAEFGALLELEKQWGLMSEEAVAAAKGVNKAVNDYLQTGEIDTFTDAINTASDALLGLPETKTVTLNINTTVNGEEASEEDIYNLLATMQ